MQNLVDELKGISLKKRIVTSVEYDCKTEEKEDEVFEMVRTLVTEHLDEMAKITFDIESDHRVKVEVIQNL